MTSLQMSARWLAAPLLLLASCTVQGSWGSSNSTSTWDRGLSGDQEESLPGITSGSISKVALDVGGSTFHLVTWSSADHFYSSGSGPLEGAFVEGEILGRSDVSYPITLTSKDGVQASGRIGDEELAFEGSAFLLLHIDEEGLAIKEVEVPADVIRDFAPDEEESREAFMERFHVDAFFKNPWNR